MTTAQVVIVCVTVFLAVVSVASSWRAVQFKREDRRQEVARFRSADYLSAQRELAAAARGSARDVQKMAQRMTEGGDA